MQRSGSSSHFLGTKKYISTRSPPFASPLSRAWARGRARRQHESRVESCIARYIISFGSGSHSPHPLFGDNKKPSAAGSGGSGAAAPDYCAEVSEVHKQLIGSVKNCHCPCSRQQALRRRRPSAAGSGGSGAAAPYTLPNQATTEPSPSQEKPSAAASGGTAQRSTKHCQCSNDSKRFTRFARLHLLSAQRIYSAQR